MVWIEATVKATPSATRAGGIFCFYGQALHPELEPEIAFALALPSFLKYEAIYGRMKMYERPQSEN